MIKTKWNIEPNRVTIFPFGYFTVLGIGFGCIFAALFALLLFMPGGVTFSYLVPFIASVGIVTAVIFAAAQSSVVFDNDSHKVYRRFANRFTTSTYKFDEIAGISIVNSTLGAYNYRAFLNRDKHGKGIPVSSGYSKRDDRNALALNNEVFPMINSYLKADGLGRESFKMPVTSYEYFKQDGDQYSVKKSVVLRTVLGLLALYLGYFLVSKPDLGSDGDFRYYIAIFGSFAGGLVLLLSAFTKVIFDKQAGVIRTEWPLKLRVTEYRFNEFTGFNIVRRTTNAIYSGTDVRMNFQPQTGKAKVLPLKTFRNTKKIERLLDETRSIMQSSNDVVSTSLSEGYRY